MTIIVLYILSFLLVEYISKHFYGERMQRNVQLVLCFLMLFVFFSFRDLPVLNDTAHYYRYSRAMYTNGKFEDIPWYTFNSAEIFEEGFQIFTRFIGRFIWSDPYALIFVASTITTISLLWFLKSSTPHIAFALFVLFAGGPLTGYYTAMRQSLAVTISYMLYVCYKKGYFKRALLCGIIAYFFHHSAIMLVLPIVLYHIPFTKRNIAFIMGGTGVAAMMAYTLLALLGYSSSKYFDEGLARTAVPLAQILDTLFVFGCLAVYYFYNSKQEEVGKEDKLFVSFALSALVINIVAIPCLILFRFAMYFSQYAVILFVNSLYKAESGSRGKPLKWIVIIVLMARTIIVLTYRNNWSHLIPYSFFDFGLKYHQTLLGY